MKFILAVAFALIFGAVAAAPAPSHAQDGKSTMETGSNATDTKAAGARKMSGSSGKMSGGLKKKKK